MAHAPSAARRPRWNWAGGAVALWSVACLGIAVHAYAKPHRHTVFKDHEGGCHSWWAGTSLYDAQIESHNYRYSPSFAVLSTPLVVLPSGAGNALWKILNAAVFGAGVWAWCRRVVPWVATRDRTAGVFLLTFAGAVGNLYNGQANLMMTGLVLLAAACAARDRWWGAACLLAAATLIKAYPLALALVLGVLFWRTFPLRFAAALLVGLALPFAAQRPEYVLEQTTDWLRHLVSSTDLYRFRLRSLDKLLEVAGAGVERRTFRLFAIAGGAAVLAVGVFASVRFGDRRLVLTPIVAWFLTWILLFSPATENATFSILAPIAAWAAVDAMGRPRAWLGRVWLLGCLYLMGLSTSDAGGPIKHLFQAYCAPTVGALMFQVWLIAYLRRTTTESFGEEVSRAPPPLAGAAPISSRRAA